MSEWDEIAQGIYDNMSGTQRASITGYDDALAHTRWVEGWQMRANVTNALVCLCERFEPHTVEQAYRVRCPNCKSDEFIRVQVLMDCELYPDGSEIIEGDHEWHDDSPAYCTGCEYRGKIKDFEVRS